MVFSCRYWPWYKRCIFGGGVADVGRSTSAHGESAQRHAVIAQLESWGAWVQSIPAPHAIRSIAPSPACRLYVARYADDDDLPAPRKSFDAADAQAMDYVIASNLSLRYVCVMVCEYVLCVSSRDAARKLTMMGYKCTHTTYRRWVENSHETLDYVIHRQNA